MLVLQGISLGIFKYNCSQKQPMVASIAILQRICKRLDVLYVLGSPKENPEYNSVLQVLKTLERKMQSMNVLHHIVHLPGMFADLLGVVLWASI